MAESRLRFRSKICFWIGMILLVVFPILGLLFLVLSRKLNEAAIRREFRGYGQRETWLVNVVNKGHGGKLMELSSVDSQRNEFEHLKVQKLNDGDYWLQISRISSVIIVSKNVWDQIEVGQLVQLEVFRHKNNYCLIQLNSVTAQFQWPLSGWPKEFKLYKIDELEDD